MLKEAIVGLQVHPGGRYIDCTLGLGGHSRAILEAAAPGGRLLGLDADPEAIARVGESLKDLGEGVTLACGNFRDLAALAEGS